MNVEREKLGGGLFGMLVGDALGVPYEFHSREQIPEASLIEMEPPRGFSRAHRGIPIGTWSDDGAQALCLLASLLHAGKLVPADFAKRLVAWFVDGTMAVDGKVFDVGVQTGVAIRALMRGEDPLTSGPSDVRSNGNGSLMRVLPLALWHRGTDAELVRDAYLQSSVTHGHARSRVACALYCLWARRILADEPDPWASATASIRTLIAAGSEEQIALDEHLRPDAPPVGRGSGYVVDTLISARMVNAEASYEACVRAAIGLGDDTDTTACVAGGIAGLRHGEGAIPARWREALRGKELVLPLLDALVQHRAA